MADYGRPVEFGISILPAAASLAEARALARQADAAGLDLIGIQDQRAIEGLSSCRHFEGPIHA